MVIRNSLITEITTVYSNWVANINSARSTTIWSAAEGQSFVPTISGQVPTPQDHIQMEMGLCIYCTSMWDALAGVQWRE